MTPYGFPARARVLGNVVENGSFGYRHEMKKPIL